MKTIYCSTFREIEHCDTCHNEDAIYTTTYKEFVIKHCCSCIYDIKKDIDKHEDIFTNESK